MPPNFITTKTRKGKTILKPRVPTKLTNNIGKSEACFTKLAIIEVSTEFHLKIEDSPQLQSPNVLSRNIAVVYVARFLIALKH
ncbi:MAG TPA: hypothetical protein VFJ05_04905 [Nitrososphaeraceae archaeon]|nr:hypothetical protein [Nitrososphaeraceae archaeon]